MFCVSIMKSNEIDTCYYLDWIVIKYPKVFEECNAALKSYKYHWNISFGIEINKTKLIILKIKAFFFIKTSQTSLCLI